MWTLELKRTDCSNKSRNGKPDFPPGEISLGVSQKTHSREGVRLQCTRGKPFWAVLGGDSGHRGNGYCLLWAV